MRCFVPEAHKIEGPLGRGGMGKVFRALDPKLNRPVTLERIKSDTIASERLEVVLLIVFAIVAVFLAAIGIYGVISYSVAQRTQELGIRAALGAYGHHLLQLILYRGLSMTVIGIVIGVGGSIALTRVIASLLYGVGARDPLTMSAVAIVLSIVALAACYLPARRAAKVDPIIALRFVVYCASRQFRRIGAISRNLCFSEVLLSLPSGAMVRSSTPNSRKLSEWLPYG